MGFAHFTPAPCSVHLGRGARVSIEGTVQIHRGTRVFVHDGGHLEIGTRSFINDCSTVTCFEHIKIGSGCAISWNTNILDTNAHELTVEGIPRPRSQGEQGARGRQSGPRHPRRRVMAVTGEHRAGGR
jgi:acetyltransferase-like isoleucine patch superfamily enzyme